MDEQAEAASFHQARRWARVAARDEAKETGSRLGGGQNAEMESSRRAKQPGEGAVCHRGRVWGYFPPRRSAGFWAGVSFRNLEVTRRLKRPYQCVPRSNQRSGQAKLYCLATGG